MIDTAYEAALMAPPLQQLPPDPAAVHQRGLAALADLKADLASFDRKLRAAERADTTRQLVQERAVSVGVIAAVLDRIDPTPPPASFDPELHAQLLQRSRPTRDDEGFCRTPTPPYQVDFDQRPDGSQVVTNSAGQSAYLPRGASAELIRHATLRGNWGAL